MEPSDTNKLDGGDSNCFPQNPVLPGSAPSWGLIFWSSVLCPNLIAHPVHHATLLPEWAWFPVTAAAG